MLSSRKMSKRTHKNKKIKMLGGELSEKEIEGNRKNTVKQLKNTLKIRNLKRRNNKCDFEYKLLPWVQQHEDELDWSRLSRNVNAVDYLEKNLDKVNWSALSLNPNAIHILEKNLEEVDWEALSANPNAIPILEKNLDYVDWEVLSANPSIFYSDKNCFDTKKEENLTRDLHP
jgi:DNA mismatch repair ATPase MutS